jgi:hypothetical protein
MALFGRTPQQRLQSVLDLREAQPKRKFGYPTPCPECGANGYLDSIDVHDRVMYQHCTACSAKWKTSEVEFATTA